MKTIVIGSIFVLVALMAVAPAVFADHAKETVSITPGSSAPGCEATNNCYDPSEVTIDVGGEVTWSNDDTAAHTVTSGDIRQDGPDGHFDSGLFMAGKSFTYKFEEAGEFPYFCQVHPWMTGMVIVQEAHGEDGSEDGDHAMAMSADGSVAVGISSGVPTEGDELSLEIEFTDADGNAIDHVNYDIIATQDGNQVLSESGLHSHDGLADFTTSALRSDSPVDVQIKILGLGLPDDQANWEGPMGETISVQVVPEFGQIAMMILAVAIVSIVAVTARSKVIPRL
ncbi:PEFG-CTERM sorting domain-containing protein [Candidatus Nitrosotenuis chungbukensis]|uniref:PEFG-CTERM sorting domain-containing protein n=2 Tax=Candidatus Nitrosotenuis chungbukensis TaxID=1353246 RepID=UPI0005B2D1BC|nr:PEFG-CTERM sorting domain-containing protein [Candidatus Nitrosotenuis chungbukensis]